MANLLGDRDPADVRADKYHLLDDDDRFDFELDPSLMDAISPHADPFRPTLQEQALNTTLPPSTKPLGADLDAFPHFAEDLAPASTGPNIPKPPLGLKAGAGGVGFDVGDQQFRFAPIVVPPKPIDPTEKRKENEDYGQRLRGDGDHSHDNAKKR